MNKNDQKLPYAFKAKIDGHSIKITDKNFRVETFKPCQTCQDGTVTFIMNGRYYAHHKGSPINSAPEGATGGQYSEASNTLEIIRNGRSIPTKINLAEVN